MQNNNNHGGIDVAMLITNERDTATCVVQMPTDAMAKFESIGQDEDGPYLIDEVGNTVRIGTIDRDEFEQALSLMNVRLHLLDETGLSVAEYDVFPIVPENTNSFGA